MTAYVKDAVYAAVRKGLSNAEIIAANPRLKAGTIERIANKRRRELGIPTLAPARGKPLVLPANLQEELKLEAIARDAGSSANKLAIQLLSIIVQDRLFDAVLGEAE